MKEIKKYIRYLTGGFRESAVLRYLNFSVLPLITGLLILSGCVKETGWDLDHSAGHKIIVDGILTDEGKVHTIVLTRSVDDLNQAPDPVSGATLMLSNEDSAWMLTERLTEPGHYCTPEYFSALPGKYYTLQIYVQDQVFTARSAMTEGSFFRELIYLKNETTGLYYIDWVANSFNTGSPAMWEVLLDWSKVNGYTTADSLETHARLLFYTLPTLDVSELFAPIMEAVNFPQGTVITERRYSLTPEHAEFVRELLLETNWAGGLFTTAASNVTTNLSGGAAGFFGVCSVTELSVIVGASK